LELWGESYEKNSEQRLELQKCCHQHFSGFVLVVFAIVLCVLNAPKCVA